MNRAYAVAAACALGSMGCGLDVGGSATADGGLAIDAGADATVDASSDAHGGADAADAQTIADASIDQHVPPTCSSIDTTCLGATVPSDWSLVGIAMGTKGCPSSDFDALAFVTNPRLRGDSCACEACTTRGSYTCDTYTLKLGSMCAGFTVAGSTSPQCIAQSLSGMNAKAAAVPDPPGGNVSCTSNGSGTGAVDTDALSACVPNKCQSDYCGLRMQGFATCIVHDGAATCPAGFPRSIDAGNAGAASCNTCACTIVQAECRGTFRVFDNSSNCDGNGAPMGPDFRGEFPADGQCHDPMSNYDSIYYVAAPPPQPSCSPSMRVPNTGTAALVAPKTICCTP
jgi:hypothetical protein